VIAETLPDANEQRIHVIQGECRVSTDACVVLTTTLGSCIAACLRDPVAGVGGMNHFLLPDAREDEESESLRYGAYAMEVLVNGLLRSGAKRARLEAKLFGGGRLSDGLTDIGEKNASFAEHFLMREGIALVGGSLRGRQARRIQFWPVSGRARQLALPTDLGAVVRIERHVPRSRDQGSVELFDR
jgi:chemotaxis protein CheD